MDYGHISSIAESRDEQIILSHKEIKNYIIQPAKVNLGTKALD